MGRGQKSTLSTEKMSQVTQDLESATWNWRKPTLPGMASGSPEGTMSSYFMSFEYFTDIISFTYHRHELIMNFQSITDDA